MLNTSSTTASVFFSVFNQQGSPCCLKFLVVISSYHSTVTPISALYVEKIAETVFLYVFKTAFPASNTHKKTEEKLQNNFFFCCLCIAWLWWCCISPCCLCCGQCHLQILDTRISVRSSVCQLVRLRGPPPGFWNRLYRRALVKSRPPNIGKLGGWYFFGGEKINKKNKKIK